MAGFMLASIPHEFHWRNQPVAWHVDPEDTLTVTADAATDWFIDPAGAAAKNNAPSALFAPPDTRFRLSAKVSVAFASMFDAGVLEVYARDDLWAKLCFEYAPQRQPMIVSVVTRGMSDDCNSTPINGTDVYLRMARNAQAFAFHYSRDGHYWHLVRHFTLGAMEKLWVGVAAQAPTGDGCTAVFSAVTYQPGHLTDIRNGA